MNSTAPVQEHALSAAEDPAAADAADAGVALHGVTKRYGGTVVVDGIDLVVRQGEFVTLLGPSGSGKTTCLNMIAGFTPVTAGEVYVNGKSVTRLPAHKRDLGVVFQNYALFPHMTVSENIEYPLKRRRIARARRAELVSGFLDMIQLGPHAQKLPSELSGGQQQRVALARALVYQPSVLLMDEPLGALDKKLREGLQLEIKRIHEEVGSTFLFVTHDQEEALSMSDRIAVFNEGRIEQFGPGELLYQRPKTLFVGQFLGESTVIRGEMLGASETGLRMRMGDSILRAVPGGPLPSSPVLFLRPENLTLGGAAPSATADWNRVGVRLVSASYLGAHWKYQVELPDGSAGTVRSDERIPDVSLGEAAVLSWPVSKGIVLPDVAGSASPSDVA